MFQSLWLGRRLSPLEHLCLKSFVAHGHRFVLYVYEEVDNVPAGCVIEDARGILAEEAIFRQESGLFAGSWSTFSNRFRYEMLRKRGGWWVDTDVLCLTPDIPDSPYVFAKEDDELYVGGILKAPADSAFLTQALARSRLEPGEIAYAQIGPALVDQLVRELGLEDHARPREDFYPLHFREILTVLDPARADQIEARVASSTFAHFYTNVLRLAAIVKDLKPPRFSYLDRLYTAYDVDVATDWRYDWADIEPQYLLQQQYWRDSLDREGLVIQLREATAEFDRIEQSVTVQLVRALSDRFYRAVGRESLVAGALQAFLQAVGRRFQSPR